MDAGFIPALPFHHGYLEPDCVERRGGGAYARDKNTSARLCAKNAGGAYARGGGGGGVFAGHYGIYIIKQVACWIYKLYCGQI